MLTAKEAAEITQRAQDSHDQKCIRELEKLIVEAAEKQQDHIWPKQTLLGHRVKDILKTAGYTVKDTTTGTTFTLRWKCEPEPPTLLDLETPQ